ncbi:MAG: four helix bundle protein [Armatimonadia bacterium]|nr:four helix bundle protein [Armatimonadia bacterium]
MTGHFPRHELYGLTSQMRRCASSIAANIAEGRARSSDADFRRFLYLAAGSVAELETFLELSRRLHYASEEKLERMRAATREVGRMLYGLIRAITRSIES